MSCFNKVEMSHYCIMRRNENNIHDEYIESYNKRFAKEPYSSEDIHRALLEHEREELEDIFCWQEDRTLSENLTIQYDKVKYLIDDTPETRKLRRKRVTVYDYYDGSIKIKYGKSSLSYRVFDKLRRVNAGAIIENERLGDVLSYIKELQDQREEEKRSKSCPKRRHLEII